MLLHMVDQVMPRRADTLERPLELRAKTNDEAAK
jgi:hypothetical protein